MATEVYKQEKITLQDGTEVTLKPLVISQLRKFMKEWKRMETVETEDEGTYVYVDCCGICLSKAFEDAFDNLWATGKKAEGGEVLHESYRTYLEDVLDTDTIFKILDVCAGIKLDFDPKLLEALAAETPPTE